MTDVNTSHITSVVNTLKKHLNIIILSNIPEESANDRICLLKKNTTLVLPEHK